MNSRLLAMLIAVSHPVASNALEVEGSKDLPSGLEKALARYYEAENDHRWEITYSMRPKLFRSTVPFELYAKEMSAGMEDWKLVRLRASLMRQEDLHIFLGIVFTELPASSSAPPSVESDGVAEGTEWVREDGQWVCVSCGRRFRLTLNGTMVQ